MIRHFLVCLIYVAPTLLCAETIKVQVGEQANASRLMLTLPPSSEWSVTPDGTNIAITINAATAYDTSAFGSLIAASRIAGASGGSEPQTLLISMTCQCAVNSYVVNNRFLTLDVTDPADAITEFGFVDTFTNLRRPWHDPLTLETSGTSSRRVAAPPPPAAEALDTEVSAGLARATYQGFLELREGAESTPDIAVAPDILANIAIGVDAQLQTIIGGDVTPDTSVSLDCAGVQGELDNAWRSEQSLSLQLAALHRRIGLSDDSSDPAALRDLAITLVGHGFGVEALNVLRELNEASDLTRALQFMSAVLDSPDDAEPIGLSACDEGLAIWAFLDAPESHAELDPQRLMITYKLLPVALQKRLLIPFSDALLRSGHAGFRAELQDFRNTSIKVRHDDPDSPAPIIDLQAAAAPREILRADLTESDLNPALQTPRSPQSLSLAALDTLRIERRNTPAEADLLDEVLTRHVLERNYFAILGLLLDGAARIPAERMRALTEKHLLASVEGMTDPELVAFAFREALPPIPESVKAIVTKRLMNLQIPTPPAFETTLPVEAAQVRSDQPGPAMQFALPALAQVPDTPIPTFAETEALLEGSAAIRNAIESFINDTQ